MFAIKYTDAQRQAVARAVLHDGLSVTAAVARAASPDGLHGLEPFGMARSTARNLAWRAKRSRAREATLVEAADPCAQIAERLLALATRMIRHVERNDPTPRQSQRAAETMEAMERFYRDTHPAPTPKREPRPIPPALRGLPRGIVAEFMRLEAEDDHERGA